MKIAINIGIFANIYHKIDLMVENEGIVYFRTAGLLTIDQIESLELDLTNAAKTLYDFRKQQEAQNENQD